jgi:transcriptional regulator with XRE-family HTH domain
MMTAAPQDLRATVPHFGLGDRLKKARTAAGYQQQELADALGVSRNTVSNYETESVATADRATVYRWAVACGVAYGWIEAGARPGQLFGTL